MTGCKRQEDQKVPVQHTSHQPTSVIINRDYRLAFIVSLMAIAYFCVFFIHGTNTPLADDYYDCLYYLYIYINSDSWAEKIHSLFWQYNQHKQIIDKVVYVLQYSLMGRVDFFWLSLIGSLQLLILPYLILVIIQDKSTRSLWSSLIPFFFFINLSLWRPSYWALGGFANIAALTLPILSFVLLDQKNRATFLAAMAVTFLATFTQGQGLLTPFLGSFFIFNSNRSRKQKKIWFCFVALLLILFVFLYDYRDLVTGDMSTKERFFFIINSIHIVMYSFLVAIGSAPFNEFHPDFLAAATGVFAFFIIVRMLSFLWRNNRTKFYLVSVCISYCLLTLLLIALFRAPFPEYGIKHVYDSHYKMYTLFIFSMLSVFCIEKIKKILLAKMGSIILISIPVWSTFHYYPLMAESNKDRREEITSWALHGTHDSLGFSGWPPQSEQILFMASREKIYSPFDSKKAALHQADLILETDECLVAPDNAYKKSEVTNNRGAVAIAIERVGGHFDEIWLCSSQKSYSIKMRRPQEIVVLEKSKFQSGDYSIFFLANNKVDGQSEKPLRLTGEKIGGPCRAYWGLEMLVAREARNKFCKKVYK